MKGGERKNASWESARHSRLRFAAARIARPTPGALRSRPSLRSRARPRHRATRRRSAAAPASPGTTVSRSSLPCPAVWPDRAVPVPGGEGSCRAPSGGPVADQGGEAGQRLGPGTVIDPYATLLAVQQAALVQHLEVVADRGLGQVKRIVEVADAGLAARM